MVKQLLLWARRNYIMSSKDSMWTRGCIPMEDVEQILEVWWRRSLVLPCVRRMVLSLCSAGLGSLLVLLDEHEGSNSALFASCALHQHAR